MNMVSSFKLFEQDLNSFKIDSNGELGHELREFFKDSENDYLWQLSTNRQKTTHALRHTESIPLRYLKDLPQGATTLQANQYMEVTDSELADIPVFRKTIKWFESALAATGCSRVEFGRIFASKLASKQGVDLHSDTGKYFSYYDRFHFTVTAAPENLFVIRDEECILEQDSLYWVNNHVLHRLENNSNDSRINFIIDARLI